MLELSDDEDGGSIIRSSNNDQNDDEDNVQNAEENINHESNSNILKTDQNEMKNSDTVSIEDYTELHEKYIGLKENYRKSMEVVEKYQIHN